MHWKSGQCICNSYLIDQYSLQAEVKEVLGKRTAVTKEDLEKLQYTEQVNFTCSE